MSSTTPPVSPSERSMSGRLLSEGRVDRSPSFRDGPAGETLE